MGKRIWDEILTEQDKIVYEISGFGENIELGRRPAIVVIDVTYEFIGDKPEPILESIKRFPLSCGEIGWRCLDKIKILLNKGREKKIPIYYTASEFRPESANIGATKTGRKREGFLKTKPEYMKIVEDISPHPGEVVIYKQRASAFFGTPLISHLNSNRIDTLLICGTTTSGCVRASVVDAFSYGFRVGVIEDCTFDRGEITHKINLFDMHQKYANVITLHEAIEYIEGI